MKWFCHVELVRWCTHSAMLLVFWYYFHTYISFICSTFSIYCTSWIFLFAFSIQRCCECLTSIFARFPPLFVFFFSISFRVKCTFIQTSLYFYHDSPNWYKYPYFPRFFMTEMHSIFAIFLALFRFAMVFFSRRADHQIRLLLKDT